jgi:predicted nucleotidyltransferase
MTNFAAALKLLSDAGVSFVVVGGYAAMLRGSAYLTQDLDICYERTPENMQRLAAALADLHPGLRGAPEGVPFTLDERTLSQGMNFTLQTDLVDIDLMGELGGVGQFPDLARDAISMELYGCTFRVASLDALIRSKRAAGRPKDLNALPELEALKELEDSRHPKE